MTASRSDPPPPGPAFAWVPTSWGSALQCGPLVRVARHFFSTRALRLPRGSARQGSAWALVAAGVGTGPEALVLVDQVHGTEVLVVQREPDRNRPSVPVQADIIMTDDPALAIAVEVADCVPLLLADPRTGAVAAVHAGWRGTAAGVARTAVQTLASAFGAVPGDLIAAVGPSIGPCCYEVGAELLDRFANAGHSPATQKRWFLVDHGRPRLNLWRATCDQLQEAGVEPQKTHVAGLCTATHRALFYSHRAEGKGTGRMVGVIRAGPS